MIAAACPFLRSQVANTVTQAAKRSFQTLTSNATTTSSNTCPYMRMMMHSTAASPSPALTATAAAAAAATAPAAATNEASSDMMDHRVTSAELFNLRAATTTTTTTDNLHAKKKNATTASTKSSGHSSNKVTAQENKVKANDEAAAAAAAATTTTTVEDADRERRSQSVAAGYDDRFRDIIKGIKDEGRYRIFADIERQTQTFPVAKRHVDAKSSRTEDVTIWCSNDYLGMGQSKVVVEAMTEALLKTGAGAGGTRNISGNSIYHVRLEQELSSLHKKEASLLFTSGYVANETTLETLASALPGCIVYSDEKNHASMIAGIRNYSKGKKNVKHVFRHNDVNHLRQLLQASDPAAPKVIAFESVYSMDGAISPIKEICDVADEFNAITYLDEVHAVGMYGPHGAGVAERDGQMSRVTIVQGTLGKAFGLMGGYISSTAALVDVIRSKGSGFIFTTSLPPHMCAGAVASIRYLKESSAERDMQKRNVIELKRRLLEHRIPVMPSVSHIIPVLVGDSVLCSKASSLLLQHGIYIQPINYPTVPVGTERLRITPGPRHTDAMMTHLVDALVDVWKQLRIPTATDELLSMHKSIPDPRS